MNLKQCTCGEQVVSLIIDNATGARFCFHCAPDPQANEVKVTRKLQDLYVAGILDEKHYPLKERLRNLQGDWTTNQLIPFDSVVSELRKENPGRVTVVSYAGIKFARECGIDCWHLAGSMAFQHVIHDFGTPEEKQRLRDLKVGYWA